MIAPSSAHILKGGPDDGYEEQGPVESEFDGGGILIHNDLEGGPRAGLLPDEVLDRAAVGVQL